MKLEQNNKDTGNSRIDENWFDKIALGDNDAFTELYYASYKQLYGFLLSLTRNKEELGEYLYYKVEYADIVKWQTDSFRKELKKADDCCICN